MIFAYLALIICGAFCIGFTIYEHKKLKQKDLDTEVYNQSLQTQKQWLEQENTRLETEYQRMINSNQIIFEQNNNLIDNQNNLKNQLNELIEQQQTLITEVEKKKQEKVDLNEQCNDKVAQMLSLNQQIETISGSLKANARAAFEQYCEALDYQYLQKETEYDLDIDKLDQLYFKRLEELDAREYGLIQERREDIEILAKLFYDKQQRMSKELQEEEAAMRADLDSIRKELEKIRATKAAAMEAQLREEEIKNQATFYTLQLNDADKRDVAYLQSIEYNLREARPLRMLIWSTFYRDKVNDLAARVGALGASGIYKITHIDSGISYIGQAKDIKERWVSHVKCSLGIDTPVTSQLYAFTREKGIDNFTFEILEKCSINELNEKEKFYIDLYQTYDFGLNANRGVSKN